MDRQMLGRLAPLGLLAAALLAPTNAHAGLGEALERMREGVQTTTGRLQGGFVTTRERLAEGITVTAEQLNAGLSAAGEQLGTALQISAGRLRRQYLMPTEGTESFEFQLRHQGFIKRLVKSQLFSNLLWTTNLLKFKYPASIIWLIQHQHSKMVILDQHQ